MTAAVGAFRAGEGRDGGSSIDDSRLALGRIAHPYIDVMSSVALVERTDLLLTGQMAEIIVVSRRGRDAICLQVIVEIITIFADC